MSEPCEAKWILNDAKDAYIRVSARTGYEIPIPRQAQSTYEYVVPEDYVGKTALFYAARIELTSS